MFILWQYVFRVSPQKDTLRLKYKQLYIWLNCDTKISSSWHFPKIRFDGSAVIIIIKQTGEIVTNPLERNIVLKEDIFVWVPAQVMHIV